MAATALQQPDREVSVMDRRAHDVNGIGQDVALPRLSLFNSTISHIEKKA